MIVPKDITVDKIEDILYNCGGKLLKEIELFDKFVEKGLKDKLEKLVKSDFTRITHHDVVDILKKAKNKWEFEPSYEADIAKEHEKYITEYFNGPVFITDWPKDIKAFYMKQNDDLETVKRRL